MDKDQVNFLDHAKALPWRDLGKWLGIILVGCFIYQISWAVGFGLTLLAVIALGIYENYLRNQQRKEFIKLLDENILGWQLSDQVLHLRDSAIRFVGDNTFATKADSSSIFDKNFLKLQRRHNLDFYAKSEFQALLVPEPANPTRPNAVAVCVEELILGYLPQTVAAAVSQKLIGKRKCAVVAAQVILSASANKNVLRLDVPARFIEN